MKPEAPTPPCWMPCDPDCEVGPVHCWWWHQPNHKPGWHDPRECRLPDGVTPEAATPGPRDLGNLNRTLRLQCSTCAWVPPDDMRMDHARLHFQVEHDTDEVKLEMVAVCACGAVMTHTHSRPTGGGHKDYACCPACGSTGFVKRDD